MSVRAGWRAAAVGVLGVLLLGSLAAHIWPADGSAGLDEVLGAVRRLGAPGWLGLIVAQMLIASSGILPASLTGVAAGAFYGLWLGFGLAAVGTYLGAVLAFWLSRSLFRPQVERRLRGHPLARGFDAALGRDGWKLVCILRMSPVMPFAVTSYALGLSSVSARHYLLGTLAGVPALLGYVVLGTLAKTGLRGLGSGMAPLHWALLAAGAVSTLVLIVHVGRLAARHGVLPAGRSESRRDPASLEASTTDSTLVEAPATELAGLDMAPRNASP